MRNHSNVLFSKLKLISSCPIDHIYRSIYVVSFLRFKWPASNVNLTKNVLLHFMIFREKYNKIIKIWWLFVENNKKINCNEKANVKIFGEAIKLINQ